MRRGVTILLDLLYPPRCSCCGQAGAWLCSACVDGIPYITDPICERCGRPAEHAGVCADCRSEPYDLAQVRSVALHVAPLREAVHALKYDGARVLAGPLGHLMADYWRGHALPAAITVPVPLHRERLRQRGYNQSLLLARVLANEVGMTLCGDILARERNTPSQVGLSRAARRENVKDAFRCSAQLQGEAVLLIDDVFTTGATLEACARALHMAGAGRVSAYTLLRAVPRYDHALARTAPTPGAPSVDRLDSAEPAQEVEWDETAHRHP